MIEELKRRKRESYPVYPAEFVHEMIDILLPIYKRFHKGANKDLTKEAEALVMLSQDMLKKCKERAENKTLHSVGTEELYAQMRLGHQHSKLLEEVKLRDKMSCD